MLAFWLPIMLIQEEAVEIKVLMRRDAGIREMARLAGSRNTIRHYLREPVGWSETTTPNQT
jgi:hypothetical protein